MVCTDDNLKPHLPLGDSLDKILYLSLLKKKTLYFSLTVFKYSTMTTIMDKLGMFSTIFLAIIFIKSFECNPVVKFVDTFCLNLNNNYSLSKNIEIYLKTNNTKQCQQYNKINYKNNCYAFGVETPTFCDHGEVIVFKKPKRITHKKQLITVLCRKPKCNSTLEIWWPSLNKCVDILDFPNLCDEGSVISQDMFGEGICKCSSLTGQLKEGENCYKYYQRGPCDETEVFVYDPETTFGKCQNDSCLSENNAYNDDKKTENQDWLERKMYVPLNGQCVKLRSSKGCQDSQVVQIDSLTLLPKCVQLFITKSVAIGGVQCVGNQQLCDDKIQHFPLETIGSNKDFF